MLATRKEMSSTVISLRRVPSGYVVRRQKTNVPWPTKYLRSWRRPSVTFSSVPADDDSTNGSGAPFTACSSYTPLGGAASVTDSPLGSVLPQATVMSSRRAGVKAGKRDASHRCTARVEAWHHRPRMAPHSSTSVQSRPGGHLHVYQIPPRSANREGWCIDSRCDHHWLKLRQSALGHVGAHQGGRVAHEYGRRPSA